jgi:hypothetical protein
MYSSTPSGNGPRPPRAIHSTAALLNPSRIMPLSVGAPSTSAAARLRRAVAVWRESGENHREAAGSRRKPAGELFIWRAGYPSYASRTEREDAADLNYDRHSENGERAEPGGEHFVRTVMEDYASIPDANEADCHALG